MLTVYWQACHEELGGWGSPPATMNVVPSYFHTKIEEK